MLLKNTETFVQAVRAQRIRDGLTQAEFAEKVGMSRRWVQSLEAGILTPSLTATLQVATALGCEVHLQEPLAYPEVDAMFESLK